MAVSAEAVNLDKEKTLLVDLALVDGQYKTPKPGSIRAIELSEQAVGSLKFGKG